MEVIHCNNFDIVRFVNYPVSSNAYVIVDRTRLSCIVIDPGSKNPCEIDNYIKQNRLLLDYIILTHEHFDHCWGVNKLLENRDTKLISTQLCSEWIKIPLNYFNKLYYDSNEFYSIDHVDIIVENIGMHLQWNETLIEFIEAKGHTDKSICILINGIVFTGDTIIKDTKPVLKKKYGASMEDLKKTISHIYSTLPPQTLVLSGHGMPFRLYEMREFYQEYFSILKL